MSPEEAEHIVYEFGECLEKKLVTHPQNLDKSFSNLTRNELRIAVMLFLAKKKYEGDDILYQHILPDGQRVATLELADNVWNFIPIFGAYRTDIIDFESSEKIDEAYEKYKSFIEFLTNLSADDTNYWTKINEKITNDFLK